MRTHQPVQALQPSEVGAASAKDDVPGHRQPMEKACQPALPKASYEPAAMPITTAAAIMSHRRSAIGTSGNGNPNCRL